MNSVGGEIVAARVVRVDKQQGLDLFRKPFEILYGIAIIRIVSFSELTIGHIGIFASLYPL